MFAFLQRKKNQFLLSVGDEGAVLVYMAGGTVEGRFYFSSPDAPELERIFASDPEAPVSVLVDVSDQSYLPHSLPPVNAMNVQNMARRRLEKEFDRTDIKGSLLVGRAGGNRKDWNFIFTSIRNGPPLSNWLSALSNFPNRITGLYLLPVETEPLIAQIKKAIEAENVATKAEWQMLVSHHKTGGLRQVVYRNGRILFTRMAQPVGGNAPGVIAGHIEQETVNTLEYLRRLNYEEAAGLDLFIITASEVKKQLEANQLKASKVYILTPHEVATQLQLERATEPKDKFSDVVMLAYFGKRGKPVLKLTTPDLESSKRYQLGLLLLKFAAIILLPLLALFLLYNIYTSFTVSGRITAAEEALKKVQAEQRTLQQRADAQKERRTEVQAMVALYDEHSKDALVPFSFLKTLHEARGPVAVYDGFRFSTSQKTDAKNKKAGVENIISFNAPITYPKRDSDAEAFIKEVNAFADRVRAKFKALPVEFSGLPGQSSYTLSVEGGPVAAGSSAKTTNETESKLTLNITGPLTDAEDKALFFMPGNERAPVAPTGNRLKVLPPAPGGPKP